MTQQAAISTDAAPYIIPRSEHNVSRKGIDESTLKVLYRLQRYGYTAYLVGGGVRDLLLGRQPKDFDVVTDATPEQVRKLFRNGFIIGKRFRLVHVRFGRDKVVEVATFRRHPQPEELPEDPLECYRLRENFFGTPAEDAGRRDFTINALYYNIADFSLVDYVGGMEDLNQQRIRVIGDPAQRFEEDPVRMLRAIEFAGRLGFSLHESIPPAIHEQAPLLLEASTARLREEIAELFRQRIAARVLGMSQELELLPYLLPGLAPGVATWQLLEQLDTSKLGGPGISEPTLVAALHLECFLTQCPPDNGQGMGQVLQEAEDLVRPYCRYFQMAHGIRQQVVELLAGCYRLLRGRGRRGESRFLQHPHAYHALQLLRLWSACAVVDSELLASWERSLQKAHKQAEQQGHQKVAPRRRAKKSKGRGAPQRRRSGSKHKPS